jgi:aminoacylase
MSTNQLTLVTIVIAIALGSNSLKVRGIEEEDSAVTNFREYLRINSAHPTPDYESCITWIRKQAQEIGLDFHMVNFEKENEFAILLTWNGTNPSLQSILINSHMDVVAVDKSKWTHDPFEAFKDANGTIYARGAVDMKSATVAALEAIRRLKTSGFKPLRTIHVSITPDEEIGGYTGMKLFVKSPEFAALNVAFDLDEASLSTSPNEMFISYGEKSIWQFNFTAVGEAAHASTFPETTAGQKLQIVIDKLMEFRAEQLNQLENNPNLTKDDITSVNLVRMGGGTGNNIIPTEVWASFDMRIRRKPGWDFTDVVTMLDNIAIEAGPGVSYTFIQKAMEIGETAPNDSNIWWVELQKSCGQLNVTCKPRFLSGATDGRYVRNVGIPVFGINPFSNTENWAHRDNERIHESSFLKGIERYAIIIKGFSSLVESDTNAGNSIGQIFLVGQLMCTFALLLTY